MQFQLYSVMLLFIYICGLQSCDNMTWFCLVPRPPFLLRNGMEHKNKQVDYFPHRKAEVSLVTAAASWRHISSFGNFHWADPQNRTEILVLAFRNTRRSYKYWYLVRYLCWVQHDVATVTHGASRRPFPYVRSGCVTCSDDVGLPEASNVGRRECVSLMVESYLTDTQFETLCAHGLGRGRSVLDFLLDSGETVGRVLP